MKTQKIWEQRVLLAALLLLLLYGCTPVQTDTTLLSFSEVPFYPAAQQTTATTTTSQKVPWMQTFSPRLEWLRQTRGGSLMDIYPTGEVICVGDTDVNYNTIGKIVVFTPEGGNGLQTYQHGLNDIQAMPTAVVTTHFIPGACSMLYYRHPDDSYSTRALIFNLERLTCYTNFYRPAWSPADFINAQYLYTAGPFMVRGPAFSYHRSIFSAWGAGTFTDRFKPAGGFTNTNDNTFPTRGKADCFVTLYGERSLIVKHQWGGVEDDILHALASDKQGNLSVLLQAGTDFAITSATQTLVKMSPGYNLVTLDTAGLLTATFPIRWQAQGDIAYAELAFADGKAFYISAFDVQRRQFFLAKVSPSGTQWVRYFPAEVSTKESYFYKQRPHLAITTDRAGNVYVTGSFHNTVDFGGQELASGQEAQLFVASYSPNNVLRGVLGMGADGSAVGHVIRLSPSEDAVYLSGWGVGSILGVPLYDRNLSLPTRDRVFRSPAFVVKLKIQ